MNVHQKQTHQSTQSPPDRIGILSCHASKFASKLHMEMLARLCRDFCGPFDRDVIIQHAVDQTVPVGFMRVYWGRAATFEEIQIWTWEEMNA